MCAAALLGVYTYILAINLQNRIQQVDAASVIKLAILNANGSIITTNVSGYGFFSADVYTTKNATNLTSYTLLSTKNLTACVGLPGYWCYSP